MAGLSDSFRGKALLVVFVALFVLTSATSAKADANLDPSPGYLKTETGAIFSAAASAHSGICAVDHCWTPSVDDINRLERDLLPFLASSTAYGSTEIRKNIVQYKRKYFGFTRKGTKFILVSGLCEKYWRPASKKFLSPQRPMTDMGSCFFSLDYDVKERRFSDLYVDGEG
ncbi:hypothetical protein [Massilia sp. TWR1-2-2]|uniref:hypothetical protein n=1 Tax=Massilia sp. TWR1-2-2 TaxID=2804584 RepID=UPI003CE7108D